MANQMKQPLWMICLEAALFLHSTEGGCTMERDIASLRPVRDEQLSMLAATIHFVQIQSIQFSLNQSVNLEKKSI